MIPTDCVGFAIIRECTQRLPSRRPSAVQLIDSVPPPSPPTSFTFPPPLPLPLFLLPPLFPLLSPYPLQLDLLISSFSLTAARVVLANFKGDPKELPRPDDASGWYNVFLAYNRDTFDVLLASGMHGGMAAPGASPPPMR